MALKKQTNNTAFEQEPTTGGEAPFDVDAQGSDNRDRKSVV